jgi:uncharacterized protein
LRIGIIGTGIAGMTAAHLLQGRHEVHIFEADSRPGGHANTVTVQLPGGPVGADTGFLVYNERTYPLFTRLLAGLGVATHPSEMSFSLTDQRQGVEWRGTSLSTVFAQRRNAVRPAFLAMMADVLRFNRLSRSVLDDPRSAPGTLADLLAGRHWSAGFIDWYLVPLGSAIWSADPATFTQIPARTFVEFFSRHGLLGPGHGPAWRTVTGGSTRYVEAILEPFRRQGRLHLRAEVTKLRRQGRSVELLTAAGPVAFDHVVVATHSDQALALLADPTQEEHRVLGAFRYQPNRATLHTDTTLLPANRRAWASWNYMRPDGPIRDRATLTYYLNPLQGLRADRPLLVTLNRDEAINPELVLERFDYAHPVIDLAAVAAQADQRALSSGLVSYCGAYWGYGFHEDGVRSALAVCERLGARL